jgi:hypothetical protein
MDKEAARKLIKKTFQESFDKESFTIFIKNLLNHIEEAPFIYRGNFDSRIKTLERIGKYQDEDDKQIDVLVVHLKKESSLDYARTMQRNFIAWYLKGSKRDKHKDAALVAFVSPNNQDWRFSLVKMEYKLFKTQASRIRAKEELTPAKRYSFLVGMHESSHTAQSRLSQILEDDVNNPTLQDLEDAFKIEKVTKEFFKKYHELFLQVKESLDEIISKNSIVKKDFNEKNINSVDFSKKLLGQIVFLYFLQKKGWFGVRRREKWGTGSKNFLRELFDKKHSDYKNFYNDILEPLFYEALRQDHSHDDDYYSRFDCRIPFLNGGLFDPLNNYDWVNKDILLSNDLFSNRNKTKEEDEGTGILDIFDRYNFTVKEDEPLEKEVAVDPEMLGKVFENLLEVKDRKSKGTYYTPREIVHYMCQESLINYLATELKEKKIDKKEIETLIKLGELFVEHDTRVANNGKETATYSYKIPENIRKHAGLIDEKLKNIRICDPAVGSGAFPVGMMNEIIRIRNVLTSYIKNKKERTMYSFKRHAVQNCLYGVDIDLGAVEIAKLRLWLSLAIEEEDIKQIKPLPNLDYKIVCGNSLLRVEKNLFNQKLFNQLEKLKPLYFNETNISKKQEYKNQIDELINKITNGHKDFDFEIYFSEVFHEKKGFDLVIGNPPYVQSRNINKKERYFYWNQYLTDTNHSDSFSFFIQKGIRIFNKHGILTFIVSETWRNLSSYRSLRKFILDNSVIRNMVFFDSDYRVFEAAEVKPFVIILQNKIDKKSLIKVEKFKENEFYFIANLKQDNFLENPDYSFLIFDSPIIESIINKIRKSSIILSREYNVVGGLRTGDDRKFLKNNKENQDCKKLIRGRNFKRYYLEWKGEYVWYKPELMKIKQAAAPKEAKYFENKKIIVRMISGGQIIATLDKDGYYLLQDNMIIQSNKEFTLEYLLCLLNSKLLNFYIKHIATNIAVTQSILNYLPIREIDRGSQDIFTDLIVKIITITRDEDYKNNPTKQAKVREYENQIDQLVYKLYGLTKEEVKIVEDNIK